jgi:antitoxin component YwqK of YwqJK toxin-antitoxin module
MRINIDDADMSDDHRLTYQGEWFTGEAVETARNGQVIALTTYYAGMEDGPSKEWYPDGQPKSEGQVRYGMAIGTFREWHRNGRLAVEQRFDDEGHGRQLSLRRWDEDGNLIEDKTYRPSPR